MSIFDDWRYREQKEYLENRTFLFGKVRTNDHEHCEFCYEKFIVGDNKNVYVTLDGYCHVCEQCFEDFKSALSFRVFELNKFNGMFFSEILSLECSKLITEKDIYAFNSVLSLVCNLIDVNLEREKLLIVPCLIDYRREIPDVELFSGFAIEVEINQEKNELINGLNKVKECLQTNVKRGTVLGLKVLTLPFMEAI